MMGQLPLQQFSSSLVQRSTPKMVSSTHESRDYVRRGKFAAPVERSAVEHEWARRGFRLEELREGPGGELRSMGQSKDELVVVAEGEVECEVAGGAERCQLAPGDELFVPEATAYSARNVGASYARIFIGYA
jgi:uncharacterized cupin superfamily protein